MVTDWRLLRDGALYSDKSFIRAKYGFHYIRGNRRPYFGITADIAELATYHNRHEYNATGAGLPESGQWKIVGGGCCHEDIAKSFPELAYLIKWHLCDDDGTPMHYLGNASYWLQKHFGVYRVFSHSEPEGRRPGEGDPLETFKHHIVFGALESDGARLAEILAIEGKATNIPDLVLSPQELKARAIIPAAEAWMETRLAGLSARLSEDIGTAGVQYIQPSETFA